MRSSPPLAFYKSTEEREFEENAKLEDWRNALYNGTLEELQTNMIYSRIDAPILPGSDSSLPIIVAAGRGRKYIELCLQAGANVNSTSGFSGTALQHACADGSYESSALLLQYGADPNAKGGSKGTALIAAVRHRKFELSELLLNHGADANQLDAYRFASPLSVATDREMTALLLKYGANPNQKCRDAPALIRAVERSDTSTVNLLLEHGADPNSKHKGINALELAVVREEVGVIEALMAWGATVEPG